MRSQRWVGSILAAALATGVYACADREGSTGPAAPETVRAEAPSVRSCDTRAIASDARSYFSQPEVRTANELVNDLSSACSGGVEVTRIGLAWQLLALVETALEAGRGGDAPTGASLVNGLVDCIETACASTNTNDLDMVGALGPHGIFAVRGGGTEPALARAPVSFVFDGVANKALWGIEVELAWSFVTGTERVLLYGSPRSEGGATVLDRGIGSVQYDMNRYPVPEPGQPGNPFQGDALHVGVCFETDVALPHPGGDESRPAMAPRMQREAVLLETDEPGFCAEAFPTVQSASFAGAALAAMTSLLPRSWRAPFFTDIRAPSLGGTPLNFSDFVAVAAETEGTLEFVEQPPARVVQHESLGEIRIRARSGAGTPMEKVRVRLSIRANQGVPAGAVLSGDTLSVTDEAQGVALFPDDGSTLSLGKAGGYLVCANATLEGFTFPEVCSDQVHVRKATGG